MPDKSIAEKLFIKEGYRVLILNEAEGYREVLGSLPQRVTVVTKLDGPADVVQLFVTSREDLEGRLEAAKRAMKPKGILWVTYPKGTSKIKADINRDSIREYARSVGLEAVAMISIDDVWSGLRLKLAG